MSPGVIASSISDENQKKPPPNTSLVICDKAPQALIVKFVIWCKYETLQFVVMVFLLPKPTHHDLSIFTAVNVMLQS